MLLFELPPRFTLDDLPPLLRPLAFADFLLLDFLPPVDLRALDLLPPFFPPDFVPREAPPDLELFVLLPPDFFDDFDPPLPLDDFFDAGPEDLLPPDDFVAEDFPD